MPMSAKLLRPRQTIHPEAADWANRVRTNGGSVSGTTLSAVDRFVKAIHAAGIRDRFFRVNLFCGNSDASLAAVRTPLFRGPSLGGTQYGNATDTNVNFVQGDYAETGASGGLKGNGTTKRLDTGLTPDMVGVSSGHMSVGLNTYVPAALTETPIGASNGTTDRYNIFSSVGTVKKLRVYWGGNATAETADYGASTPGGVYIASRTSATLLALYKDGLSVATLATSVTPGACPYGIIVFGTNTTGTPSTSFSGTMKFYSVGSSLTESQATAFTSAIQSFMAAIGRSAV